MSKRIFKLLLIRLILKRDLSKFLLFRHFYLVVSSYIAKKEMKISLLRRWIEVTGNENKIT